MINFLKKRVDKASKEVKDDNWEEAEIPVYFAGEKIGLVFKMTAKEVAGIDMFDIWITTNKGSGIEPKIISTIKKQGIYLGKPIDFLKDDT